MAVMTGIETNSANLPEGVTAEQVLGGARFPIEMQLLVDGDQIQAWTFQPSGLHKEGATYALENIWLAPGNYNVSLRMMDDGESWREVFSGPVTVGEGRAAVLTYTQSENAFTLAE